MSRFIILSTQRTGSTLLQSYLDQHSNVDCYSEMFLNKINDEKSYRKFKSATLKNTLMSCFNETNLMKKYLDNLLFTRELPGASGFKLMYNQIAPSLLNWIDENDVKIIHMTRKNTLKIALSRKIAKITRKYHSHYEGMESYSPPKVYLNPDRLIIDIQNFIHNIDFFREIFKHKPSLEICYEDLVHHKNSVTEKIFNFFEVPLLENIEFPTKKINPQLIVDLLQNYDEVYEVLNGTVFQCFLEED